MPDSLDEYLSVWGRKPVLRLVYSDFYNRIATVCGSGLTIEIGGEIGNLKRQIPNVVATDIQFAPWLDCVADAQHLPFADGTAANIVMVDVLHHLEFPTRFFREAERLLRPGGRIIMVEPAITWGSVLFYHLFHHEKTSTSADPLIEGTPDPKRDPYELEPSYSYLDYHHTPGTVPEIVSEPQDDPRRAVFIRRLPAERRVQALDPHFGGISPPPAQHRASTRAGSRSLDRISNDASDREDRIILNGRKWLRHSQRLHSSLVSRILFG